MCFICVYNCIWFDEKKWMKRRKKDESVNFEFRSGQKNGGFDK